ELRERVGLLDRLRPREREEHPPVGGPGEPLELVEGLVPRELVEAADPDLAQRVDDAVMRVEMGIGEAALVAEPAPVDLRVVARKDSLRLPLARRREDVAADGAVPADRRHVLDLPRARLEPVL